MHQVLEDQDYLGAFDDIDNAILRRATCRLSELLPRQLRFSEAWQRKKEQTLQKATAVAATAKVVPHGVGSFRGVGGNDSRALKVYVRLRPLNAKASHAKHRAVAEESIVATSDVQLTLHPPQNAKRMLKPLPSETLSFTHVYGQATTQQEYYEGTTVQLVHDLVTFKARNSVIMAYGSSGAGKTYSMQGPSGNPGLLPRALTSVFEQLTLEGHGSMKQVAVSYYEVYNDVVFDLLEGHAHTVVHQTAPDVFPSRPLMHSLLVPQPQRKALRVREDARGRVHIPGLLEILCASADQAIELMHKGSRSRQQASTGVNATSSRSHCVFTIKLTEAAAEKQAVRAQLGHARHAQLSFVDLAGSERAGRTKNLGDRLRESASINSSLMCLGRCLEVLKANQAAPSGAPQRVLPYRESKITHLFKDALHGWGHLVLAVSASPSAEDHDETHHVLRYAALATAITLAPNPQQEEPPKSNPAASADRNNSSALAERVAELEAELALVCAQLTEAEAALQAAEADIRDEVVGEIQDVIKELRGSYEERVADMTEQLAAKEAEVTAVEEQLADRDARLMEMAAQLATQEAELGKLQLQLESAAARQLGGNPEPTHAAPAALLPSVSAAEPSVKGRRKSRRTSSRTHATQAGIKHEPYDQQGDLPAIAEEQAEPEPATLISSGDGAAATKGKKRGRHAAIVTCDTDVAANLSLQAASNQFENIQITEDVDAQVHHLPVQPARANKRRSKVVKAMSQTPDEGSPSHVVDQAEQEPAVTEVRAQKNRRTRR